jgi:hypothetical protein
MSVHTPAEVRKRWNELPLTLSDSEATAKTAAATSSVFAAYARAIAPVRSTPPPSVRAHLREELRQMSAAPAAAIRIREAGLMGAARRALNG